MTIEALREKLAEARTTFDYRLEKVIFEVSESVCLLMERFSLNKTELARRIGVSPAYITKLLNGNPNLTIKSLLKLSDALGHDLSIQFIPKLAIAHSEPTPFPPIVQARRFVCVATAHSANSARSIAEEQDQFANAA